MGATHGTCDAPCPLHDNPCKIAHMDPKRASDLGDTLGIPVLHAGVDHTHSCWIVGNGAVVAHQWGEGRHHSYQLLQGPGRLPRDITGEEAAELTGTTWEE